MLLKHHTENSYHSAAKKKDFILRDTSKKTEGHVLYTCRSFQLGRPVDKRVEELELNKSRKNACALNFLANISGRKAAIQRRKKCFYITYLFTSATMSAVSPQTPLVP